MAGSAPRPLGTKNQTGERYDGWYALESEIVESE
jgi:hypothetical protein